MIRIDHYGEESPRTTYNRLKPYVLKILGFQKSWKFEASCSGLTSAQIRQKAKDELGVVFVDKLHILKDAQLKNIRRLAAEYIATVYKFDNGTDEITSTALYGASVANGIDLAPESYYDDCAAVKVESNRVEDLIIAATSRNEINLALASVSWPTIGV